MKHFLPYLLSIMVMDFLFWGCSVQEYPNAASDEEFTLQKKNPKVWTESSYDYDFILDPPYEGCKTGAPMKNHGKVLVIIQEKTTPSGVWMAKGWIDYDFYDRITLENLDTEEIYTLKNGTNPSNEVAKGDNFYRLHYKWNEVYTNAEGENVNIHAKGYFTIDKDGNVTKDIYEYKCN